MKRGDIFDARLDPTGGSEQAGFRPFVIVSRDALNAASPVVLAVPCTTYRPERRIYPSQVLILSPDGGFESDSLALAEQTQAIAKTRLIRQRGSLSPAAMARLDIALLIALDLGDKARS